MPCLYNMLARYILYFDIELFKPIEKNEARKKLNLDEKKKIILFAGAFDNTVKNPLLAKAAVELLQDITLLELKGYHREQVALLFNAVDVALMTSFTEGSPQFVKEAMASNCPIVSVQVGDVAEVVGNVVGCYLSSYDPTDVAGKLKLALGHEKRTEGRKRLLELGLDSATVAARIKELYEKVGSL